MLSLMKLVCTIYSTPDYQGGLQYAELEEEVSNYHFNNIMNGLAPCQC